MAVVRLATCLTGFGEVRMFDVSDPDVDEERGANESDPYTFTKPVLDLGGIK